MFILASGSPRRQELLSRLGIEFQVMVPETDETMDPAAPPEQEVARLSLRKALTVPAKAEDIVLAADTIVVCGGRVLGKPRSPRQAAETLRLLSGREHQVMTGFTLLAQGRQVTHTEVSHIWFRPLLDREIDYYVSTGDPMDKAGSYGIQTMAAAFVEKLEGDYYNVVGLPLCALTLALRSLGVPVCGA